jgi:uncharacterized membrane protein
MSAFLPILSRWTHIVTACIAIGGVFFLRIVLPVGLRAADEISATAVLLKCRRVFKMTIHTALLLFLISGTYNIVHGWADYKAMDPAIGHSLLGLHLLLGLIVLGILMWILAAKQQVPAGYMKWLAVSLGLMLVTVAVASTLKTAREAAIRHPAAVSPAH